MEITLREWSDEPENLDLLFRMNAPEMTAYLGGPESEQDVRSRHGRYLRFVAEDTARMFRIEVDGEIAGSIGYWLVEEDGVPAFETGWSVLTQWQGRGIAREALRRIIDMAREDGRRSLSPSPNQHCSPETTRDSRDSGVGSAIEW